MDLLKCCYNVNKVQGRFYIVTISALLQVGFVLLTSTEVTRPPKRSAGDILDRLTAAGIVDDIIQRAPYEQLEVYYQNWTVDFGNEIPTKIMNGQPEVRWPASNGTMYSLLAIGPDVPTREKPEERDWLHWLVGNIPENKIAEGELRADYIGLERPIYEKGTHRIVYLLYKHQDNLPVHYYGSIIKKRGDFYDRSYFSPNLFSKEHNFKNPIAINFVTVTLGEYGVDD